MEFLAIGFALGAAAGFVPGPFNAMVARTALDKGRLAGLKVSLVPLVTEVPVMVIAAVALSYVPDAVITWIGIIAGALLVFVAFQTFRGAGEQANPDREESARSDFLKLVMLGFLSPSPWIFWTVIAGPLLLSAWNQSFLDATFFVLAFYAAFVGSQMAIVLVVVGTRSRLSGRWRVRAMRTMAILLAVAGGVLVWQSAIGNFQDFVRQRRDIKQEVQEAFE